MSTQDPNSVHENMQSTGCWVSWSHHLTNHLMHTAATMSCSEAATGQRALLAAEQQLLLREWKEEKAEQGFECQEIGGGNGHWAEAVRGRLAGTQGTRRQDSEQVAGNPFSGGSMRKVC